MIEALLVLTVLLLGLAVAMLALVLRKSARFDAASLQTRFDTLEKFQERGERTIVESFERQRQDAAQQARGVREEVQATLKLSTDSLVQSVDKLSAAQQLRLAENAAQLQQHFDSFGRRLTEFGQAGLDQAGKARAELATTLKDFKDSLQKQMTDTSALQKQQLDSFATQIARLIDTNEKKSDELRAAMETKLTQLQADNTAKLEEMRRTVDEKLQGTLEKRLGESFKLVSERLELVHKGLGEMQTLATGVGDLKRVLTNVKTRGTWSEVQLGNLLDQILTPEQYARNVATNPNSREFVEFALRLPGHEEEGGKVVWLPIDAKFPKEDYERLVDAAERGDANAVAQAGKDLDTRVRAQGRDIRDKYLSPPHTTDFGLLYLPTEGLYAEVIRRPGLCDALQRDCRVVIVGPTTLAALLNSLQLGFRTLAIQKRSSEVWKVLGAVKTEFGKFGDTLEKVKKKLDETGATIEDAAHRSRQLEKRLRKVELLPVEEAAATLEDIPIREIQDTGSASG